MPVTLTCECVGAQPPLERLTDIYAAFRDIADDDTLPSVECVNGEPPWQRVVDIYRAVLAWDGAEGESVECVAALPVVGQLLAIYEVLFGLAEDDALVDPDCVLPIIGDLFNAIYAVLYSLTGSDALATPLCVAGLPYLERLNSIFCAALEVELAFNPADFGLLDLWVSDTGASPSTWTDLSGNGNDATEAVASKQPAIVPGVINGHQVRRFDGVNDWLNGALSVTGDEMTVFAVMSLSAASAAFGRAISTGTVNTADESSALYAASVLRVGGQNLAAFRGNSQKSTGNVTYDVPVVVTSKFDGMLHTLYLNGVAQVSVGSVGTFNISAFRLGASLLDADTGSFFKGDIAEVLIYENALSDANRGAVEAYLATKYALP